MQRPAHNMVDDTENAHYLALQQAFFAKSDFWDRPDPKSFLHPKSEDEDVDRDDRDDAHYRALQQAFFKGDFWDRPDPKSFLYPLEDEVAKSE